MTELKDMSLDELWALFPIVLKDHNPAYTTWYSEEAHRLEYVLGSEKVRRINHIGSTSVAGLKAKPIIDILLELDEDYSLDAISALLEARGWLLMARNEEVKFLEFNKGYTPQGYAQRVFHLHIKPLGDHDELYFRDYLRDHSRVRREYEILKQNLKKQFEPNRDAYTEAKSDFVKTVAEKARREYGTRYAATIEGMAGAERVQ